MQQAVVHLLSVCPEVVAAAIVGGDGEMEAFSGRSGDMEEVVGPVGTTLISLAVRAVQELGRGGFESLILEGTHGHVVARELGEGRTLVAVADAGVGLGLLLDDVRACAEEVARA